MDICLLVTYLNLLYRGSKPWGHLVDHLFHQLLVIHLLACLHNSNNTSLKKFPLFKKLNNYCFLSFIRKNKSACSKTETNSSRLAWMPSLRSHSTLLRVVSASCLVSLFIGRFKLTRTRLLDGEEEGEEEQIIDTFGRPITNQRA